ncbi:transmembrane protein 87B-like [Physella acuta]|uniref:transmembrane protein 87B-like n=1 Tax=Physella acuta TaxID=109671 RepID=UPI0027DB2D71|nr:transmembrane protein 87B-like [Physella acuta]
MYRHFRNVLILYIIAVPVLLIWFSIEFIFNEYLFDWKTLWMDNALWHIFFSVILIVIMVLWRPTSYNLRYAFSALLDVTDDNSMTQKSTTEL